MIRVKIICEGESEETFVGELLRKPFLSKGIELTPILLGGSVKFQRIQLNARNILRQDKSAYCTTFIDFYGLPARFPGKSEASGTSAEKAQAVCAAMHRQFSNAIGENVARRFIPYVQMHEFEALLFSDPKNFAAGIYENAAAEKFQTIRDEFDTPEDINDNTETAPSKRVLEVVARYDKPV